MKVSIVVTHLLGTGHLSRAMTLAEGFATAGHNVSVISGGVPVPQLDRAGIALHQLPPVRSQGTDFTRLLDAAGAVVTPAYLGHRQQMLCTLLQDQHPDVLITELFPFGRRILAPEFTALLQTARTLGRAPLILSSIRDILAPPSKPSKVCQAEALIDQFYDGVLVHSDPDLVRLQQSWPVSAALAQKLHYTGYVAPPPSGPHPQGLGLGEILVSAGGGAVGLPIFKAAIEAATLLPTHPWRLLVGGGVGQLAHLQKMPLPPNLTVQAPRSDFRQMLYGAAASVSMCGYNTTLDLLQAGTPAILVPFDAGNEVEQTLRACSLAKRPGIAVITTADLTPSTLADRLTGLLRAGRQTASVPALQGTAQTVRQVEAMTGTTP